MLIVEKLLNKKYKNGFKIKSTPKRLTFSFSNNDHFITIEILTSESFIFFFDDKLLGEFEYFLGLSRQQISELTLSWFLKKLEVNNFDTLQKKTTLLRDHVV